MLTLEVDFNDVTRDGSLVTDARLIEQRVYVGSRVRVHDELEDEYRNAVVRSVDGKTHRILLEVDWDEEWAVELNHIRPAEAHTLGLEPITPMVIDSHLMAAS
ncbi:hypothetical protein GCM10009737_08490 [Nocardioides lentus]|uniref:Uncharacterized protein n=1 Tax=Nocardioides lentus TaxID=338077 RepID=A0ABN2P4G1_9ACTN